MPSFTRNQKQFGGKVDPHETRGLIFNPETLAEAEARIVSRTTNPRSRTPGVNTSTMNHHKRTFIKICVVSIIFLLLLFFQFGSYIGKPRLNKLLYSDNQTDTSENEYIRRFPLQLDLPHCKIPKVETYSKHYTPSEISIQSCENELIFSSLQNGVVHLEGIGLTSSCCVSEISRPNELTSDTFENRQCIPFNSSTTMKVTGKEFLGVACTNERKSETQFNFHANIIPSAEYLKGKIDYWKQQEEMPVNVLVLVLDSTSRTDVFRHLPKTMDYLLNVLNFVDFKGFHHLGEPTMLNAIPLLLGVPMTEYFGNVKPSWEETWDNSPFIWREFNDSNYATAYIEDVPDVGTFNYGGQTGFTYKPTDFYLRPFLSANVVNTGRRHKIMEVKKACIGKTPMEKFIMNYQLEMLKKMNGLAPVFSMPWICWPQHDFAGLLYQLENTTMEFFQNINNEPGLLENTLTIVMADHGFYDGPYAQSHEGLLERRLPLFLIRLPAKLKEKHPEFADRIQENSQRITSHYDVYKTLLHLAQLAAPGTESVLKNNVQQLERKFGRSLLELIPESRTCLDAGIPENNCACNLPSPPAVGTDEVPNIMRMGKHAPYF